MHNEMIVALLESLFYIALLLLDWVEGQIFSTCCYAIIALSAATSFYDEAPKLDGCIACLAVYVEDSSFSLVSDLKAGTEQANVTLLRPIHLQQHRLAFV